MKIWVKKFTFTLTKYFFFTLFLLFVIFVIADFSFFGVSFIQRNASLYDIAKYYSHSFLIQFDLLAPFSFLLASIFMLTKKNQYREILALQMAGISKFSLLMPIFYVALVVTFFAFSFQHYFQPKAYKEIESFQNTYSKNYHKRQKSSIASIDLPDNSTMVFSAEKEQHKDLFWIIDSNHFWYFPTIKTSTKCEGLNGLFFVKSSNGYELIEKVKEYQLPITADDLHSFVVPQQSSLFSLCRQLQTKAFSSPNIKGEIEAQIFNKLVNIFQYLLITCFLFPLLSPITRKQNTIFIFVVGIFTFFLFRMTIEAMIILTENNAIGDLSKPSLCTFLLLTALVVRKKSRKLAFYKRKYRYPIAEK